jgi:tRNA nucleotidyltransferase/poly(A) polymerase
MNGIEHLINNVNTLYTGGFVRDIILAKPLCVSQISKNVFRIKDISLISSFYQNSQDIDLATTFNPGIVAKIIDTTFPNSKRIRKFATNTFVIDGRKIEITSTRIDQNCDGKNAQMKFGASFYKDSFRRDFTFNALYMRQDGLIFDFHQGIDHINKKEIHFIGNASSRIHEDYTRIKRYYNFSKRFNMQNSRIEQEIDYIMKNSTKPIIMR